MDTSLLLSYLKFGVSICFLSWVFALFVSIILKPLGSYESWSNINLVHSKLINKLLLVNAVQWVIKNTFFKYFNPAIKLANADTDLVKLRHEMTACRN